MATITFDTRKAVRKLQAAGFPEPLADGIVDTVAEAFTDTVATKANIAEVKTDIAEGQGRNCPLGRQGVSGLMDSRGRHCRLDCWFDQAALA